jgi:paired amphipathic helix protein Sin3a
LPIPPSQGDSHIDITAAAAATNPAHTTNMQEPSKPLDVTDALSYLDLVKVQFENLPAIYNR